MKVYILKYLYQDYDEPKEFIQKITQLESFNDLLLILDQIGRDQLEWANELIDKSTITINTIDL